MPMVIGLIVVVLLVVGGVFYWMTNSVDGGKRPPVDPNAPPGRHLPAGPQGAPGASGAAPGPAAGRAAE